MSEQFIFPNPTGPTQAVSIDSDICIGCNSCADICRIQTILPSPVKGQPPVVAYPDECWYCGCCVEACPTGALQMRLPIGQRILFKDKETGTIFRLGTQDAPDKSFFKAPFGWIDKPRLGMLMRDLESDSVYVSIIISDECGKKIGRYFADKEEKDNTGKLIRFLKKTGFDEIIIEDGEKQKTEYKSATLPSGKKVLVKVDIQNEGADNSDYSFSVRDLSDLLHRLCVSNFTAVDTWKKL